MKTRIVLLGATGSVGSSVVDIVTRFPEYFQVEAVVGGTNVKKLAQIAHQVGARFAAVADSSKSSSLKSALTDIGLDIECGAGKEAVNAAVDIDCDLVVAAIAGTAGLGPTHRAIRAGRRIALANKETLVCAGEAFMRDAHAAGVAILPLDSEHNAIWQAMGSAGVDDIEEITLTASGGPFLHWSREAIAAALPEQALKHPNYDMGAKISIDSASMMNKGLEVIEAYHLFGIDHKRINVLVHPQQLVHGLVSFRDGSVTAGMAMPDMRIPAAHCLSMGLSHRVSQDQICNQADERLQTILPRVNLARAGRLDFLEPDTERFPALPLAFAVLAEGGGLPTVLNAANEIAVEAYLARQIGFNDITALVEETCNVLSPRVRKSPQSIDEAIEIDADTRQWVRTQLLHRFAAA